MRYLSSMSLAIIVLMALACTAAPDNDATVEARLAQERSIEATVEARVKVREEQASEPTATPWVVRVTATPAATPKDSYFYSAEEYRNNDNWHRAIDQYTKHIERFPDYAPAYNYRGVSYGHLGEFGTAVDDYTKAIEIDPLYFNPYANRGVAYYRLKNYPRAINDLTTAIQLDPDDALITEVSRTAALAFAYSYRGKSHAAIKYYQLPSTTSPRPSNLTLRRPLTTSTELRVTQNVDNIKKQLMITPKPSVSAMSGATATVHSYTIGRGSTETPNTTTGLPKPLSTTLPKP